MNHWIATGRLTDNVELRYTAGENQLAFGSFTLAVDDGYGEKKKTSFFRCTIFGRSAEAMEKYTGKGVRVIVEGRPQQDTWKDKDGHNRSSVSFIVTAWEFAQTVDKKPENEANRGTQGDFMSIPDGIGELEGLPFD